MEELLAADHQLIDELLASLGKALEAGVTEDAGRHFRAMADRLGHHMEWEEAELFPAVPPSPRMAARHVESLKIDHERIRRTLGELSVAIERKQGPQARAALDDLRVFLAGHNGDEEVGIYREADRVLDAEEKLRMTRSFQRA